MMIGQIHNLAYIDKLKNIPQFIVIVGSKGSGKTTMAKYVADKLSATFAIVGIKVDDIREVIDTAYKTTDNVVYCIKDADTMRNEAKNALLKITEEPPASAHFIMTVEDESSLLDTIKSRACLLHIEPYTHSELIEYFIKNYPNDIQKANSICNFANKPYEIDLMVSYGQDFITYVNLVIDNIASVHPANAFKSSSKLALKSDEGYDLKMFWSTFSELCVQRLNSDPLHYAEGVCATAPFIARVMKLGVNKQQLYDEWVFKIREVWS